jgi:hypothetical protein
VLKHLHSYVHGSDKEVQTAIVDHHGEYDAMVSPGSSWTSRRRDQGPRSDMS